MGEARKGEGLQVKSAEICAGCRSVQCGELVAGWEASEW